MKRAILSFILLATGLSAAAQSSGTMPATPTAEFEYSDLQRLTPEDYIGMRLPPLHVLIANARKTPQIDYYEANREIEERELKNTRRTWQHYLKLNAGYSYGVWDTWSQNFVDTSMPVYTSNMGRRQNWWSVGASVSIPLDEIFNRRNRAKQQKKRIEITKYDTERWYDELKLKVIDAYTIAIEQLSILPSAAEAMATAKAQYRMTEVDFVNGQVDIQTLSRQKSIESVAIREYEQIRSRLNTALLRLEIMTRTPIISRPE